MKFKVFFTAFLLSLPFWWGMNLLEKNLNDFFFWEQVSQNPQIFTAQIAPNLNPIRLKNMPEPEIEAKSVISVFLNQEGEEKILFEKNADVKLPVASLTKLMTALVILKNYNLNQEIEITEIAANQPGQPEEEIKEEEKLKIGENFKAQDLLYSMLMESNNSAAFALADVLGQKKFTELMNQEAENLGLESSYFQNSTGLDPKKPQENINYSTGKDLVKLTNSLLYQEPVIWEILATPEFNLYTSSGIFHHKIINTNELLGESIDWGGRIVGGKTGETPQAGGCLLLTLKVPKSKGYLINVILNSESRFEEMKKLIDWLKTSYKW